MFKRTPDIFLSPKQLDQRAAAAHDRAKLLRPGLARARILKEAKQDKAMADMKRLIGEDDRRRA